LLLSEYPSQVLVEVLEQVAKAVRYPRMIKTGQDPGFVPAISISGDSRGGETAKAPRAWIGALPTPMSIAKSSSTPSTAPASRASVLPQCATMRRDGGCAGCAADHIERHPDIDRILAIDTAILLLETRSKLMLEQIV
jgi:hypothetical protein